MAIIPVINKLKSTIMQGLGKTLQSIAFIAHILHECKEPGPHLVVVPLTIMANWISEFKKFCPSIKVLRFHTNDATEEKRLKILLQDRKKTEVVVTTYGAVSKSGRHMFNSIIWRTLILDEGHKIKNDSTLVRKQNKTKMQFKSKYFHLF